MVAIGLPAKLSPKRLLKRSAPEGAAALATIDPDLDELLTVLLASPAAPAARAAIDAIIDEAPDDPVGRLFVLDEDAFHFEFDRRSRYGQLDLAHRIITTRTKREIHMLKRLRELAPELGLTSLTVLPPPPVGDAALPPQTAELLDPRREKALHDFLSAWNEVQAELRQRWETSGAG